ncbi:MAG: fimbria major subunit [Muribaculaceae bacterium]|nr:fimbria major subunit [Muribaculaceae bacterium]
MLHEDSIHDINIFFYQDANGLDGDENTKILHQVYVNVDNLYDPANTPLVPETQPEFEKNYLKLQLDIVDEIAANGVAGTNFAAVANFGEIQKGTITTLGQLRELQTSYYTEAWKKSDPFSADASKVDYFLMSTAYNQDYTYGGEHTGNNKVEANGRNFIGTTTLERVYARIDLWYNAQENAGIESGSEAGTGKLTKDRLVYKVNKAEGNKVYIYNILPVNVMRQPSFLFKKVSSTEPTSWGVSILQNLTKFNWGGKEQVSNGCPSNYVLEPNTTNKTKDGTGNLETWYGISRTEKVKTDIEDVTKGKISSYYSKQQEAGTGDPTGYNCDRISIISYANENTQGTDCFHPNYLTGLAFRAIYVPEKIYKSAEIKDENLVTADETLAQIYRYSPTAAELEEAKSLYFSNITAAQDYAKAHPGDMAVISQYTATKHIENDETSKWGFICYYNLWLRHYNDVNDTNPSDPHEHLPMEYATVRNNIYRVKVDFNGPGDPSPTMRAPDTMKARIYVRKWNWRPESDIIFD